MPTGWDSSLTLFRWLDHPLLCSGQDAWRLGIHLRGGVSGCPEQGRRTRRHHAEAGPLLPSPSPTAWQGRAGSLMGFGGSLPATHLQLSSSSVKTLTT